MKRKKKAAGIKGWSRYKTQNSFRDDCHLFRYLFLREETNTHGRKGGIGRKRARQTCRVITGIRPSRSLIFFSFFFAFCNVYCRVECNFLTLKIWDGGTRRPFGDRRGAEVDANAPGVGWCEIEWKRARMRKKETDRKCTYVGRANESDEKKSRSERKDYIGDFGFRVSSGRKADFPIFRLSRDENRHSN